MIFDPNPAHPIIETLTIDISDPPGYYTNVLNVIRRLFSEVFKTSFILKFGIVANKRYKEKKYLKHARYLGALSRVQTN